MAALPAIVVSPTIAAIDAAMEAGAEPPQELRLDLRIEHGTGDDLLKEVDRDRTRAGIARTRQDRRSPHLRVGSAIHSPP